MPEVAALAGALRERTAGRTVARLDVVAVNVLKTFDPPPSALAGLEVTDVRRHGKFLDLDGDGLHLVLHLARAGWLRWKDAQPALPPRPGRGPLALRLHLDDGSGFDVTEAGTQKRLAAYVVRDPSEVPGIARLGVDVLDPAFTPDALAALLCAAGRAQVKGVVTDQSVLAGVGNAYSDEVLWHAGMSPFTPSSSLDAERVAALHGALVATLREAVAAAASTDPTRLKAEKKAGLGVHGRTGLPCPRCGDVVREVSFATKSLQYCATCQTGGRPLADRRLSRLVK